MTPPDGTEAEARAKEIEARAAKATRGPWWWNINLKHRQITLDGYGRGVEYVLSFFRWGMRGAGVRFSRDGLLVEAQALAEIIPGHEHHAEWMQTVHHPDADFIAHAREDIPWLLGQLRARTAERDEAYSERAHAIADLMDERDRLAERVRVVEEGLRAAYGYIMFHPDCEACEQSREIQDSSDATCKPHLQEKNALWDTMKAALQAGARGREA